jgi:hypothetical protein
VGDCEELFFNANSAIFQLFHGENKLIFNEMMRRSAQPSLGMDCSGQKPVT